MTIYSKYKVMKKEITKEQKEILNVIINKNGFLTKNEILKFSKEFNINLKLFRKLLKESKIPFKNRDLENLLNAYDIKSINNRIELSDFIALGEWKIEAFKSSKMKITFCCEACNKKSELACRNIIKRDYFSLEPICNKCINKKVTSSLNWLKNTSVAQKICKNRPEFKENQSKKMIEVWKKDGYKENQSNKMLEKWQDENYRQNILDAVFEKYGVYSVMQNEKIFSKSQKNSFKFKEYIMPSGKIIKLQGYENKALDILLKEFKEEDLIIGNKNIQNKIGKIFYTDIDNIVRRYFPDIYIISINKIIEVKSTWIYNKCKINNDFKKQECLDRGFNFDFMIFLHKMTLEYVKTL